MGELANAMMSHVVRATKQQRLDTIWQPFSPRKVCRPDLRKAMKSRSCMSPLQHLCTCADLNGTRVGLTDSNDRVRAFSHQPTFAARRSTQVTGTVMFTAVGALCRRATLRLDTDDAPSFFIVCWVWLLPWAWGCQVHRLGHATRDLVLALTREEMSAVVYEPAATGELALNEVQAKMDTYIPIYKKKIQNTLVSVTSVEVQFRGHTGHAVRKNVPLRHGRTRLSIANGGRPSGNHSWIGASVCERIIGARSHRGVSACANQGSEERARVQVSRHERHSTEELHEGTLGSLFQGVGHVADAGRAGGDTPSREQTSVRWKNVYLSTLVVMCDGSQLPLEVFFLSHINGGSSRI